MWPTVRAHVVVVGPGEFRGEVARIVPQVEVVSVSHSTHDEPYGNGRLQLGRAVVHKPGHNAKRALRNKVGFDLKFIQISWSSSFHIVQKNVLVLRALSGTLVFSNL